MADANNSTLEFNHGGTISIAHSPAEARTLVEKGINESTYFITLQRMRGEVRDYGHASVEINPRQVCAVYPLDTRSVR